MKQYIIVLALSILSLIYVGCEEEEPVTPPPPPPPTDTNAVNFNNLIISERTPPSFDDDLSAVDFHKGLIILDSSSIKDANLVDSLGLGSVFYFRSGDQSDEPREVPGYQTRFKVVALTLTQAEFDTMKTMPDTDSVLTENDFLSDQTESFSDPLLYNSVYGFYLKGKYDNGVTPNRVFGMFYLEQSYTDTSGFKLRFDVKINKAGENRFKSQ